MRLNLTKSNTNISKIVISTPDNRINGQFDVSLNNNRYALEPYSTVADSQHTVTLVCATAQDITDGHNFDIALPAGAYSNLVIDIYDNANNKCTKRLNSTHTLTIVTGQYTVIELNGNSAHHELDFEVTITGDLPGLFSVSATKQVKFSKGNLQYIPHSNSTTLEHATTDGNNRNGKYQFAENQWIRKYTAIRNNINDYQNPLYTGWLDLFAWGYSGFLGNNPYTASNIASTLNGTNPIAGTGYDWGVYNAISNGGDEPGLWRTLTKDEWNYLLTGRPYASTKWARANVHGTNGYILQPDEWIGDTPNVTISWGSSATDWTTNTITDNDWTTMENAGAVFLPVTGYVYDSGTSEGVKVNGTTFGYYWTATASTTTNTKAYDRKFTSSNMEEEERDKRYCCAVRLVHDAYTYNN